MMFPYLKTALTNLFRPASTEVFPNPAAEGLGKYRGRIAFNPESCVDCGMCIKVCSPDAITRTAVKVEGGENVTRSFDLTSCTFCGTCADFCEEGSIQMTKDYHMVAENAADLVVSGVTFKKEIAGHIFCDLSGCIFCGLCAKNCPEKTITVDRKTKTWRINYEHCIKCGKCIDKCPKKILSFSEEEMVYPEPAAAPEAAAGAAAAAKPAAPKKPAKPKNPPQYTEGGDDQLVCDIANCIYCGICKKNCPAEALTVDRKEKVWKVDHDACIGCGLCIDNCPKKVLSFGVPAEGEAEEAAAAPAAAEAAPAEKAAPAAEAKPAEAAAAAPAEPEGPPPEYSEAEYGQLVCHLKDCIYCGICAKNCPMDALTVDRKTKTWKVDYDKCVMCAICNDKCPKHALDFKG
ncbi:MAG: 4Fe-4S binding protein [Lachnospiraceae bacterium]|nr:4Fe-4S binding protein [Lachnospiraceae bacterium]